MSIDERIHKLEQAYKPWRGAVVGTQLTRILLENGVGWCLALGGMSTPKEMFIGVSIEEVISMAESHLSSNGVDTHKLQHGEQLLNAYVE
jgi:hypothetical protein